MVEVVRLRPACDFCGEDFHLGMGLIKYLIDGQKFIVHDYAYERNLGRGHENERVNCMQGIIDLHEGTLPKYLENALAIKVKKSQKPLGQLDNG